MIPPAALSLFVHRQKQLLRQTYDQAWQQGVNGYQPDGDPPNEPTVPIAVATAGLTGAALLAARRLYSYVAPTDPDPIARAVALAPAYDGLDKMVTQLSTFAPSDGASAGVPAQDAFLQGLQDWMSSNEWRLNLGASVAWAGEQAGFAQAADQDGQLLDWDCEDDDTSCGDCVSLGGMPPMPLSEWPCKPGDGTTECNVNCRCSFDTSPVSVVPGDSYTPDLTDDQSATVGSLMDSQAAAMASAMPSADYLE